MAASDCDREHGDQEKKRNILSGISREETYCRQRGKRGCRNETSREKWWAKGGGGGGMEKTHTSVKQK